MNEWQRKYAREEHARLTGYLSEGFSKQFKTWARDRLAELEATFPQLKGVTHGHN